jgi:hypothetical protein
MKAWLFGCLALLGTSAATLSAIAAIELHSEKSNQSFIGFWFGALVLIILSGIFLRLSITSKSN